MLAGGKGGRKSTRVQGSSNIEFKFEDDDDLDMEAVPMARSWLQAKNEPEDDSDEKGTSGSA